MWYNTTHERNPMTHDIHPNSLPRDLVQAIAVCITMQAYNNRPIHVQSIWDGLYGEIGTADAPELLRELTLLLNRMFCSGLITKPGKDGTLILTDRGDEVATAFRSMWERMGVLDISDIVPPLPEGYE
jgi:hypothetical protein